MNLFAQKIFLITFLIFFSNEISYAQTEAKNWNGKKCAVVLTYDDALNEHLDKVIPALDSLSIKATFYLIAEAPAVKNRKKEWRKVAKNGHELGNHTLTHPCDGSLPGRSFVKSENDLTKYTVKKALEEINQANLILEKIDGKKQRTFAYPCGDLTISDTLFYNYLKNDFVAARGVKSDFPKITEVDLSNINASSQVKTTAEQMIQKIEEAEKSESFIVFIFHGVGGGHSLNVDLKEHKKLLQYLNKRKEEIWTAPMLEVAKHIKKTKSNG